MKTILILLSFMFVSCVTANTESRDLSAVNTAEGKNINTAFNWKFWERNILKPEDAIQYKEYESKDSPRLNNCLDNCECQGEDSERRCRAQCRRQYSQKEGIKVASIGDQTPFNLLKESQNDFEHLSTEDNNHNNKAPIMFAVDYDCCVKGCIGDGGSSSQCHRVCEE